MALSEVQLAKLHRGMGRLIDSYTEGLIERAEFEPRIAGFRQRIAGWDGQIKAMRCKSAMGLDADQRRNRLNTHISPGSGICAD